jgi:hypothetical protein
LMTDSVLEVRVISLVKDGVERYATILFEPCPAS